MQRDMPAGVGGDAGHRNEIRFADEVRLRRMKSLRDEVRLRRIGCRAVPWCRRVRLAPKARPNFRYDIPLFKFIVMILPLAKVMRCFASL